MRNFLALAALAGLVSGCAMPLQHGHAAHGGPGMDMQAMESMHARMHERMAAAGTPAEREAMMREHHRMMREHMQGMGGGMGGGMCGGQAEHGPGSHSH